jgi:hypothetical protein
MRLREFIAGLGESASTVDSTSVPAAKIANAVFVVRRLLWVKPGMPSHVADLPHCR